MANPIVLAPAHALGTVDLMRDWLGDKRPETLRAYKSAMRQFAEFSGCASPKEALERLISLSHGEANLKALQFKNWLKQRLTSGGVNQRLSALRSFVQLAHLAERCPWTLSVKSEKAQVVKDTRGPGVDGFKRLLAAAGRQEDHKAARDTAILWLLFGMALRREGVASLDIKSYRPQERKLAVILKGHRDPKVKTMSEAVAEALNAWINVRGTAPGPMFVNFHRGNWGNQRLSGHGIWSIVSGLGRKCGLEVWPHGLRHSAATHALNQTNGNIRAVQRFTDHVDAKTLQRYDDERRDLALDVATKVSDLDMDATGGL